MRTTVKAERRSRIKRGIRKKIFGTAERPRLSVFRSNTAIYAQIINDDLGVSIASMSSRAKDFESFSGTKTEKSEKVGQILAQKAKEKGVEKIVFDRNGYKYHGRIEALARGARDGGLIF